MMTDPISDMLARIRNAILARHDRTEMPLSKLKTNIAGILKSEGYIADFKVDESGFGKITVFLKYGRDRESAIAGLRRHSRPGRRVYVGYRDIPTVHNGLGVAIMSTSHGLMTDKNARATKVGGEILCEVW
ncbi:MAG: 30S ribosomal protein S8 [Sandaracinaceae bacterium]